MPHPDPVQRPAGPSQRKADASAYGTQAILTIDLCAVVANYRHIAKRVFPATCGAVVKADAYGLGAARVAPMLFAAGCRLFFTAHPEEGSRLRRHLPDATIVVMHGPGPGGADDFVRDRLVPVLNSRRQIADWARVGRSRGRRLDAYIQVDSGMSRFGLSSPDIAAATRDVGDLDDVNVVCVMSHLACADDPDDDFNIRQLRRFEEMRARFPGAKASLSASSGCFLPPAFHFDIVRPGAGLYGVKPTSSRPNPLRPVVRLDAPVLQLRDVPAGTPVGYARTAMTRRPSRLATIGIGYADGYLRSGGDRGRLWFGDHPLPVLGRISMDSIVLDTTGVDLHEGSMIEVIGERRDVDTAGIETNTNSYEILTGLGRRYRRRYLQATEHFSL